MRLLLVDDDRMNVELFVDVLEGAGHEVVVERDGTGARERALREAFDLIVLDVQLPGLAGDEVCRALRRAGVRAPIIALSSAAMPEQIARTSAVGFDAYLTKPIAPETLREAVRRYGRNGR